MVRAHGISLDASRLFSSREYKFVRNDRILYFFNNFDDYMNEDAQWMQSEKIKPRQKATPHAWHSSHAFDKKSDIFACFFLVFTVILIGMPNIYELCTWPECLWRSRRCVLPFCGVWAFLSFFLGKNSFWSDHSVVSPLSSASEGTSHSYGTFETLSSYLVTARCE